MTNSAGDARSFWIVGPRQGEIRSETLREPNEREVIVRTLYSGISRGTEALVLNGAVPTSEFGRMRAPFQDGDFPAPVKYGYINVGVVEHGPASLQGHAVFCLYPHQTRYVVPADAVYRLPEDVPPKRAVLAANLETAVNGLWDASPRLGDRIAVIGAGVLGCLAAWLCNRIPGCEVELIDINPERAHIATALNVLFATPAQATAGADLVIHASGTAEGLSTALELAGFEATVLELSWYGNRKPAIALGEAFHSRRLTLRSSQVGTVATAQRSRWDHRRRMELALKLLSDAKVDALITGESRFEELPAVMPAIAASAGSTLCHRIVYSS
jgi:2-desacetyl-2-hydroxyethyl bacteriochlorophyllide A dehydrogenase